MLAAVASTLVGFVLLVAGVAKLIDPSGARDAFAALGMRGLAPALAVAETALGAALVVGVARRPLTAAAMLLLLAMTAALVRLRRLGAGCGCFGGAPERAADTGDVARNMFLVVLAAVGVVRPTGSAPRLAVLLTAGALVLAGMLSVAAARTVRGAAPLAREIRAGLRDRMAGTADLSELPIAGEPPGGLA